MHEVIKELKDDEVEYLPEVSPAVAMHEVIKELKDDEVEYLPEGQSSRGDA